MKAVIVSQPVDGGVAVCVRQLVAAAVHAGHEVTVVCPPQTAGPLAAWIVEAGARHVPLDMARAPGARDLSDLLAIRRLVRDADVVHLHSSKAGALGRVAVRSLGGRRPPVVFTPHAWSWLVGGRLAPLYRGVERLLAPLADRIVAVSNAEAEDGLRVLGKARGNIEVIANGVDRARFSPTGPVTARRDEVPLIVCVGRLSEQKGQDLALRALASLKDKAARLRLVGSGPQRAALEALAHELDVSDRVEWLAHQPEPAEEYRAADIVFAPSRWDGMSLVLLEAMASGAAIVATDVLGSEALQGSGVVVGREDVDAMTAALDALLADRDRRIALGLAARQASAGYDVETTLERNLSLWVGLSQRRQQPFVG